MGTTTFLLVCLVDGNVVCVHVMNVGWLDGRANNGDSVFFVDFVAHAGVAQPYKVCFSQELPRVPCGR